MGLSVGEDVSFMIIVFSSLLTFNPLKRFRVAFFFLCWRRRVYSFLHGLREPGGGGSWGGRNPAHFQRGFEAGFEGDFARDFLLRVGEDVFAPLERVIVVEYESKALNR